MPNIVEPITVIKNVNGKSIKKKIGEIHVEEKEVILKLSKTSDEYYANKCWRLHTKLLTYFVTHLYTIIIIDSVTKWKYQLSAVDFLYHAKTQGKMSSVSMDKFEVLKANNRTYVIKCRMLTCPHNEGAQCLKGSIQLNEEGVCTCLCN
jgi:hypothetical protein